MRKKIHWYPDESKETRNGYSKTACGKDGYSVGGLISEFFKYIKDKDRCKKCNKKYKESKWAVGGY